MHAEMGEYPEKSLGLPAETLPIAGQPSVYLRLVREGDDQEMYQMLLPGGPSLDRFQYWDKGFSPETVKAEVKRSVSEIEQGRMLRYPIIHKDERSERMVGEVSFYNHDDNERTAYFGCLIIPEFEGKHVVSTAARVLIKYATDRWQLKKILLEIEAGNERSEGLAQALGAKLTNESKKIKGGDRIRSLRTWEIET